MTASGNSDDPLYYPEHSRDEVQRCRDVLATEFSTVPPILGVFTSGIVELKRHILLPEGILSIDRWLFQKTWKIRGWVLRFSEVAVVSSLHQEQVNSRPERTWVEYTDRYGRLQQAELLHEMYLPWMLGVLDGLAKPTSDFVFLKESTEIDISERTIREADTFRRIVGLKGHLVALGPRIVSGENGECIAWGPVFALLPRGLPEWRAKLESALRAAGGLAGPALVGVAVSGLTTPIVGGIVGGLLGPVLGNAFGVTDELRETKILPAGDDFLRGERPYFGSIYEDEGNERKWECVEGWSASHYLYIFHNFWVGRCMLWAKETFPDKGST